MKDNNYIKSLDGLRALAVFLVVLDHWSGDRLGFPASYLGVCLFFVLSGFLITGILLKSKQKDDSQKKAHWKSLKLFFIRRTIRIFPLYYLVLVVLFICNIGPVRDNIFWLASYMTNNYIAYKTTWLGNVDHLWSLAVEEQFYIFFPFLIFFINKQYIKYALIAMVILAVLLRLYFFVIDDSWIRPYVLMPACLDAFGLGGLLSYFFKYQPQKINSKILNIGLSISFIAYIAINLLIKSESNFHNFYSIVFLRLFESLFSVFFIANLITSKSELLVKTRNVVFENSILVYLGKISYGIYIFHNFIYNPYHAKDGDILMKIFNKLNILHDGLGENPLIRILIVLPITIAIASISWFGFEKPINNLKDRFNY